MSLVETPRVANGNQLHCSTQEGILVIRLYDFGLRLSTATDVDLDYGLLIDEPMSQSLDIKSGDKDTNGGDTWILQSKDYQVIITCDPFAFVLKDTQDNVVIQSSIDGHFNRRHRMPPLAKMQGGWLLSLNLQSSEPIYGLGEKWGQLNKRGQLLRSNNEDALGVNAEISYKNVPFCWSPMGWGCFIHSAAAVTHAVGAPCWSQRSYCAWVEQGYLDCFLLAGKFSNNTIAPDCNTGALMLEYYTALTGRAPLPPVWSCGVILSKAYYEDADAILNVAREVRHRKMPCDVITFDGRAWQDTKIRFAFEWDAVRYPDPEIVIQQLKELNFKICVWEYPLVSVHHQLFQQMADRGWLLKDSRTGKTYHYQWNQQAFGNVLTPLPISGIVDFTHPEAYNFWKQSHKPLFDMGVDMIKADFGEQLDSDYMLAYNGTNGSELHNVYSHLYNRCVYEAAESYCGSGAFLFSRAAWTGSQRYNSQWGGDPQADWEGMMANFRGGLSWGLSGAPFYATDVGGFYRDTRDEKLFIRWAQAAVFSAHYRFHGIGSREPWSYSNEAERIVAKALKLRYQLFDYLHSNMQVSSDNGMPVQRAMVLAFPNQKETWAFENQFMFGSDLLVAPCFNPFNRVEVYLPKGQWAIFNPNDTNADKGYYQGGQVYQLTVALDDIAVFALKGTQIPLSKPREFFDNNAQPGEIESVWIA